MNPVDVVSAALDSLFRGSVILRAGHRRNLRWANSALTTNGDTRGMTMTVVAIDPREGGSGVGALSGQLGSAAEAVAMAQEAAAVAAAAPTVDDAELPPGTADADAAEPAAALDDDATDTMLTALGRFMDTPVPQFGYAETERVTTYLATTAGTRSRHVQDSVRFEANGRDDTGSTWWGTNRWDGSVDRAVLQQQRDLEVQRAREDLAPGLHRVLLSPSAVADLLIYLAWSANGRDAVEGHNVFSRPGGGTRIGERLAERPLTLYADPAHPGLQTASLAVVDADSSMESVFDNGLALGRQDLLRDGRLVALRASRPTAARCGLSAVYLADNLVLEDAAGHGTSGDLLERTQDAVLITCLWYIREVDPQNLLLTGLTRDGVYRVRDGRAVAALPNFRFNVAVPDLLARIVDSSATAPCLPREWADWFTRTAMPALVVDGFNLSSPSTAR